MQLYIVSRRRAWHTEEELEASVGCAESVIAVFAPDIRWIRSYVVREDDGTLSAYCVYEAADADVVRRYSEAARLPADAIDAVATTVVAAADPDPVTVL